MGKVLRFPVQSRVTRTARAIEVFEPQLELARHEATTWWLALGVFALASAGAALLQAMG